jgi:lycopene beta-cyclase
MSGASEFDCILVGGGLSNGLNALALRERRPDLKILIVEKSDRIGGNHTWSFHGSDLDLDAHAFVRPLIVKSWPGQEVRFPKYRRRLSTPYHSISSERLHEMVRATFGPDVLLNTDVSTTTPAGIRLADGREITAACVIDGRGAMRRDAWHVGYQKFFGLEVELEAPSRLDHPIIMDATVPQLDGYRFVYTLPLAERRLLIEDTYYADGAAVDEAVLERRIGDYAAAQGWRIARIARRETGVLPIVLSGDIAALWREAADGVPRAGIRAILFHPTTGYSLPDAARLARHLAALERLESNTVTELVRGLSLSAWEDRSFYRILNRLLFIAAKPAERLAVMQRFYTLPEALVRRFYAGRSTLWDKTRILTGKPPISFFKALACVSEPQDARGEPVADATMARWAASDAHGDSRSGNR